MWVIQDSRLEGGDFIKHEVFQALPELEEKLEVGPGVT